MFTFIELVTEEQCSVIRSTLYMLKDQWIERESLAPRTFFTLGVATYIDVCHSAQPQSDYFGRLTSSNALLFQHFGDLLEKLKVSLQQHLGAPVRYTERFALPGFHIFLGKGISSSAQADAHFDLQYNQLPWPIQYDRTGPISFTLPITLPTLGGGLDIWNITSADYNSAYRRGLVEDLQKYKDRKVKTFHTYIPGKLFLQEGAFLHRIAPVARIEPVDERITLQGHGLRFRGEWILYW